MHNIVFIHVQVPPSLRPPASAQGSGFWKLCECVHVPWRKIREASKSFCLTLDKNNNQQEGRKEGERVGGKG